MTHLRQTTKSQLLKACLRLRMPERLPFQTTQVTLRLDWRPKQLRSRTCLPASPVPELSPYVTAAISSIPPQSLPPTLAAVPPA